LAAAFRQTTTFPVSSKELCPMQARLKLKPGQKGTKSSSSFIAPRLACVRYRYDEHTQKRFKTVERIVKEIP
jgi:hypothetical protein